MKLDCREASAENVDRLLALMREFNESEAYPFDEVSVRSSLLELLASPSLGRIWLIMLDGESVGYLALTFGFSFEHGGRDAFVDEFFLESRVRGRGIGRRALDFVLGETSRLGIHAVHLEVERRNPAAHALYQSVGFVGNDRQLLTHRAPSRPKMSGPG